MRVLVVNVGSSSLKVRVLDEDDSVLARSDLDTWGDGDGARSIRHVVDEAGGVDAVGHRVVHGGTDFVGPALIDADVEARIAALATLAPLHQERALLGIRAVRAAAPGVAEVACFDTAFFSDLPAPAATYALPAEWRARWPIRRFGFHGLSHAYAVCRGAQVAGRLAPDARVVSCHLGAGASLCAARGGRPVDTTMGFTPLEGLVMSTRSGSVDPGLVLWLVEEAGLPAAVVHAALERDSGLAGLSGISGDMREVLDARRRGDERAGLAFEVYGHRLRAALASMVAALGGVDVVTFTGGVGEHIPEVRAAAVQGLEFLGLALDSVRNATARTDAQIGASHAPVASAVVTAREDLEIAREVRGVLGP